jgi:CRISPR-associated exonuclease Cas4
MEEDDFVSISALQHYSYCPRQCGLIHAEQSFAENVYTARGNAVHRKADFSGYELRVGLRMERALPLASQKLGLIGRADIVEFSSDRSAYPVEYKHGLRRQQNHDDIQLAAQALCLEEMTGLSVPFGAIYHASSRRRREVEITDALRVEVVETTQAIRVMIQTGWLPPPANDARCPQCSLIGLCQPQALAERSRRRTMQTNLFIVEDECGPY